MRYPEKRVSYWVGWCIKSGDRTYYFDLTDWSATSDYAIKADSRPHLNTFPSFIAGHDEMNSLGWEADDAEFRKGIKGSDYF